MIDIAFYILAGLTLPVSALLITRYVGCSPDRDLEESRRRRAAQNG